MKVSVFPHPDQVRLYAKSALNGFETLSDEDAIENAKCDLRSLLDYLTGLDRADYAVPIFGIETVKTGRPYELVAGKSD